jgi:hypothetical protein
LILRGLRVRDAVAVEGREFALAHRPGRSDGAGLELRNEL